MYKIFLFQSDSFDEAAYLIARNESEARELFISNNYYGYGITDDTNKNRRAKVYNLGSPREGLINNFNDEIVTSILFKAKVFRESIFYKEYIEGDINKYEAIEKFKIFIDEGAYVAFDKRYEDWRCKSYEQQNSPSNSLD